MRRDPAINSSGASVLIATLLPRSTDTIDPPEVGGNRIAWFTFIDVDGGIEVDNHELFLTVSDPQSKEDCKDGGAEDFGFANQGQCIQFVNTGQDSR